MRIIIAKEETCGHERRC